MTTYLIAQKPNRDLWWSNEDGWVDFDSADQFTEEDVYYANLPLEGEWVPKPIYSASLYMMDRAYGGPEEGGWWYTTYEPVFSAELPLPFFTVDWQECERKREEMQLVCDELNKTRRDIGSVLSEGRYVACVRVGPPTHDPQSKPHYE